MKIATWNINGIVKRLDILLKWLEGHGPDVLCLQELKCSAPAFPADALEAAGYGAVWRAEGRWNGVAILSRGRVPIPTATDLPGDDSGQARYIEAAVAGHVIGCVYAPNGNPQPGPKFDQKLRWMGCLHDHARGLLANSVPIVVAGDFNVVPGDADIYDTRSYRDNALLQEGPRQELTRLLDLGLVDAQLSRNPDDRRFTFWDYRRNRWERDAGLRLDFVLLNDLARDRLTGFGIDRAERGRENASDHAPVWVDLS